jgi:hypothetical protein
LEGYRRFLEREESQENLQSENLVPQQIFETRTSLLEVLHVTSIPTFSFEEIVFEGVEWIHVAQDGPSVLLLISSLMSLWVPYKTGDFFENLTDCRCLKECAAPLSHN